MLYLYVFEKICIVKLYLVYAIATHMWYKSLKMEMLKCYKYYWDIWGY